MQPPAIPLPAFPVPSCTYRQTPADISPCPRPRNGVYCFSVRSVCKIYEAHPRCSTHDTIADLQNKNRIRQFGTILSLNKTTGQTAGLQTSPCCDLGWCFFKHRFFYDLSRNLEALRIFPSFSWSGKCDSREPQASRSTESALSQRACELRNVPKRRKSTHRKYGGTA